MRFPLRPSGKITFAITSDETESVFKTCLLNFFTSLAAGGIRAEHDFFSYPNESVYGPTGGKALVHSIKGQGYPPGISHHGTGNPLCLQHPGKGVDGNGA
ncbi:hypothetical protein SAMN05216233_13711 [Desulfoluna spongiiphila]|uniref:Uncharacterized protein n=1 Tax=Desulfoluna spongiiphila TaxID=419481 RepID=A0A1G5JQV5_9BACT|nr:hypothetical protein SAMN05216233_13711 [Desulfoluna spongiiphila]